MKRIPVKDLMTRTVASVRPETPLAEVVGLLAENSVRSLPVIDDEGHLVGVVSESDLFLKERNVPFSLEKVPTMLGRIIDEHDLDQLDEAKRAPAEQVMCRGVETADEETTLEEAAMKMMRLGISNLPVVKEGKVVGILRRLDILSAIFATENDNAS